MTCLFSVLRSHPTLTVSSRSLEDISNENIACIEVSGQIDGQGQAIFTFSGGLNAQLAATKDCNNDGCRVTGNEVGKSRRTEGIQESRIQVQDAGSKGE